MFGDPDLVAAGTLPDHDSGIMCGAFGVHVSAPAADSLAAAGQRSTAQPTIDGIEAVDPEYAHGGGWWHGRRLIP